MNKQILKSDSSFMIIGKSPAWNPTGNESGRIFSLTQAVGFDFSSTRQGNKQLGYQNYSTNQEHLTPDVNLSIDYYFSPYLNNELLMGFSPSGLQNKTAILDIKNKNNNFYFISNENDLSEGFTETRKASGIQNWTESEAIAFGNCYLSSYNLSSRLGQITTVSTKFKASNINAESLKSGASSTKQFIKNPALDPYSGKSSTGPNYYYLGLEVTGGNITGDIEFRNDLNPPVSLPYKSLVSINSSDAANSGISPLRNFNNLILQSCDISLNFDRIDLYNFGNNSVCDRKLQFPINASIQIESLVSGFNTNPSNDLLLKSSPILNDVENAYDINLSFSNNISSVTGFYNFKGAKLNSLSYQTQVNDIYRMSASFSVEITEQKGFFIDIKQKSIKPISGFAYPNETLTVIGGTSYQWYIDNVARGTSQSLTPTVNDIGLTVRCVVDDIECVPVTVWHPRDIPAVKNFWWAAQGAYNTVANGVTDENASITITPTGAINPVVLTRNGSQNGKPLYGNLLSYYCYWDSANSRWELYISYGDEQFLNTTSTSDTAYPWQATWVGTTVTRQTTTFDVLATDEQSVASWREIITSLNNNASSNPSNVALFESTDLATPSIKFDGTDFFTIDNSIRTVFNSQSNCYIFAGAKDTNPTSGDASHGVVSINRTSSLSKVALATRNNSSSTFSALTSSNNGSVVSASSASNSNYNVLTNESLFPDGSLRLRVNGSQVASSAISTVIPNDITSFSYIGGIAGLASPSTTTNFNGLITAIILAANSSPLSATDRSRIERFIGLLGGLNIPLV